MVPINRAGEYRKIFVQMPEIAVNLIAEASANKLRSVSDYDDKFSAQFMVAACLHKGKLGLSELADDVLGDEAILNLAFKVEYEIDRQTGYPDYYSGGIIITTKDGIEHVHHERINRGASERALSEAEITLNFLKMLFWRYREIEQNSFAMPCLHSIKTQHVNWRQI